MATADKIPAAIAGFQEFEESIPSSSDPFIAGSVDQLARSTQKRGRSLMNISRDTVDDEHIPGLTQVDLSIGHDEGPSTLLKKSFWLREKGELVSLSFLDLPPETRNQIYGYDLLHGSVISLRLDAGHVPIGAVPRQETAIVQVSRQIHAVTVKHYATNDFTVNLSFWVGQQTAWFPRNTCWTTT